IEHIFNPHSLLREIYRVLDDNGACVMITPNVESEGLSFFDDPDHKKPYTPKGLKWLMQMYGFSQCNVGLWTVRKPTNIWGLPMRVQFALGKVFPFYGRNSIAPSFLKGRSKTMIGSFRKGVN
ncbi:class I SAM-dependent methyltransferase, partial [Alphaproteobacteria bacterium]|nr:class I SAM-dependent methyltransferase [Alphaproteobacteria bacterium]